MYSLLITIHGILRWGVVVGGLVAISKSAAGLMYKKEYTASQNRSHLSFLIFCHTQLLVGLILYFISPAVTQAFASGELMKNAEYRFVGVEHIAVMIIAIGLIQAGRTISKKAVDSASKHRKSLIFFSIGLLLILSRIPWHKALLPGM